MTKQEGEALIKAVSEAVRGLMTETAVAGRNGSKGAPTPTAAPAKTIKPAENIEVAGVRLQAEVLEAIFVQFYNRMIDQLRVDPITLQLLMNQPEIVLEIQPQIVQLDGRSPKGRVARLIKDGFFDTTKRPGEARSEMERTGPGTDGSTMSRVLGELVNEGFLTREGDRYKRAAGIKISENRLEA